MKEEQKIYIKGSKDRPNDIRKVLEQHGGVVEGILDFAYEHGIYYISHDSIINFASEVTELYKMIIEYYHEVKLSSNLEC